MNRPIAISLSPNVEADDVALAHHLLFVHSYWNDTNVRSRAAEKIASLFPGHFASLASSGRQALYDLLKAYGVRKGDEVILQAFTCIAVPEPILWVGATPIYADIQEGTYTIDVEDVRRKITPNTKAIIVQHTFGIPGPIEEIVALAKEHNIRVIEDCAHSLGSTYKGKPLGTFGDAALLSFGRDKSVSSVFGGAIVTKDHALSINISSMQSSRPLPPKRWVAQQLFHVVFFSWILPLYFWHGVGKALLVLAQKLNLVSRAVAYEERAGKRPVHMEYAYSPVLAFLLLAQLEKLQKMIEKRQAIVSRYTNELKGFSFPQVSQDSKPSYLRFPLQVKVQQSLLMDARQQQMLLGDWYDAALVPGPSSMAAFGYVVGSCPKAEDAASQVVNLPTYITLTDTQVTKIITFMNSYGNP